MQVFKLYLKILRKNLGTVMIYVVLFAALLAAMTNTNDSGSAYSDVSLKISVFDEDNTEASRSLCDYLDEKYEVVSVSENEEQILNALFYCTIDYALVIKNGYSERISVCDTKELFENYKDPSSSASQLFEGELDEYVRCMSAYITSGYTLSEAIIMTEASISDEIAVTKETFTNDNASGMPQTHAYFFQYFAFIIISVFMNAVCPVLITLNRNDLKKRMSSSSIPQSKQSIQIILGSTVVFVSIWLIMVIGGTLAFGGISGMATIYAILNCLAFSITAAGITMLCSVLIEEKRAINIATNIIGLGMSFLCGVFVPQELLSEKVLDVSRFLPAYWYVRTNDMLAGISGEIFSTSSYLTYIGIQLLFAAFLFISYILISRIRYKEEGL